MADFGDFTGTKAPVPNAIAADTQAGRILAYMMYGERINPREALSLFGCMRLAARILDLRRAGHRIEDRTIRAGRKSFKVYWMLQTPPARPATTDQLFN